jgi:hypothetical protein
MSSVAPVARAVSDLVKSCLEEEWDDPDEIGNYVANQLSARPDPDEPRRWWITLPSADGTTPSG